MWEEENKKIILASSSPRRQSILNIMGLKFDIIKPEGVEERNCGNPYRAVEDNSESKARFAVEKVKGRQGIVCGFDTLVYFAGSFLGKPAHQEQAAQFLEKLSGHTHKVLTGVCMIDMESGQKRTGSEITTVEFRKLGPMEIDSYLKSEQVLDKAGAYNIGGRGALLVKRIEGCFYNVMGLPVARFIEMLKDMNYNILGER